MISCILSSWLSISRNVLIWLIVKCSRYPKLTTSSKAESNSKVCRRISRSSKVLQILDTTCENRCSESMSWRTLLWRFVIRTRYSSSSGWKTNRTLSCSAMVCCAPAVTSLGKEANKASALDLAISRNCRETMAFPPLVHIDAAKTTCNCGQHSVESDTEFQRAHHCNVPGERYVVCER